MIVLGIDLETTWTDPIDINEARIVEIGAVLWDTSTNAPAEIYNTLVRHSTVQKEITALTGITDDMMDKYSVELDEALLHVKAMSFYAEYIVAHNGNNFDKPILDNEFKRIGTQPPTQTWIDTRVDVPYPDNIKTRKLTYLAAEHGFANPFQHRALFDVLTMLKIMGLYNMEDILFFAKQETVRVIAHVSFQQKQLAKDRGYHWDGEAKIWFLDMKKSKSLKEENEAGFPVTIVKEN